MVKEFIFYGVINLTNPLNIGMSGSSNAQAGLNIIIARLVNIGLALVGLLFFVSFFISGLQYLFAGGDEKAAASARRRLTNSFIGLIISVAAFLISQIILQYLGVQGVSVI